MSEFGYINNGIDNVESKSSANIVNHIESMICDELEGIEAKQGYKIGKAILLTVFALMTFDIVFDGSLIKLFFTV